METRKYIHSDSLYLYEPPKCKKCGEYLSENTKREYCKRCHKGIYQQEYYKKYYERKKQDKEWYEKRKQQSKEYYHKRK